MQCLLFLLMERKALTVLDRVTEKWSSRYPNFMKCWKDNWDAISLIFKFSATVRKVIYTTNVIESLNFTYPKLNRQRSVFPSDTALLKALYLAIFEAMKKWTTTIRNSRPLLTCLFVTVIYKTRVSSLDFKTFTLHYHRRILFTDFFHSLQFVLVFEGSVIFNAVPVPVISYFSSLAGIKKASPFL